MFLPQVKVPASDLRTDSEMFKLLSSKIWYVLMIRGQDFIFLIILSIVFLVVVFLL